MQRRRVTSDTTAIVNGAGTLKTVTFAQSDAAPTGGSIAIYDNTANSGTLILFITFTTDAFRAFTLPMDAPFTTGLSVDFTTTADVGVTLVWE